MVKGSYNCTHIFLYLCFLKIKSLRGVYNDKIVLRVTVFDSVNLEINPFHILPTFVIIIHLNISIPSRSGSQKWSIFHTFPGHSFITILMISMNCLRSLHQKYFVSFSSYEAWHSVVTSTLLSLAIT